MDVNSQTPFYYAKDERVSRVREYLTVNVASRFEGVNLPVDESSSCLKIQQFTDPKNKYGV